MNDIVSPILQWLNAHPHLSGLGTFIISAAESIAIIGTIIPGSVMMTAIGALAGAGVIPLYPTIIWAIFGAIVGDGISYRIGCHFKDRLHNVWPFRGRPYLLDRGESFFQKNGAMSVFIGRFVGPVRALVPLVAGMLGMRPLHFYIANVLSAIGWAPAYMLPGILLGAASLELPPDIAVHAMLIVLLVTLFVILCIWIIYKFFVLASNRVNYILSRIWTRLGHSRYFRSVTTVLKHHNLNKTYGQLTLAFYFLVICGLFTYLAMYVAYTGSQNIALNNGIYYLFRSLRSPVGDQIMIAASLLGDKLVLLPLSIVLFAWLGHTKRWRTACHVLALGVLSAISIELIKHSIHSLRPWGITQLPDGNSFPSGHTTLATVFYFGIGLLSIKVLNIKRSKLTYRLITAIVLLISVSRIYLGAHWFTDVLGGWLLGAAILTFVILSYNRKVEAPINPKGFIITIVTTFLITYSASYFLHANKLKHNAKRLDWPTYTIGKDYWWKQQGKNLPHYRINRFGFSDEILNLQWMAELSDIKTILLKNGWEIAPERDWMTVLYRLSDVKSSEHLPLVSPLYLDKKPSLVLTKHVNGNKRLVVLRLWDPHVYIQNSSLPLWVGTVTVVPRTYSWLFNHTRGKPFTLTSDVVFEKLPSQYQFKILNVKAGRKKEQPMILIQPKS